MKRRLGRGRKKGLKGGGKWKSPAKDLAVTAVMATLLVLGKLVLAIVPNVEVVTSLIMVFTMVFGFRRAIFAVLAFCLVDILCYPHSPDTIVQYLFHWPLLCGATALVCRWIRNSFIMVLLPALAAVMAVAFWLETPTIYVLMGIARPDQWMVYAGLGFPFFIPSLISGFGGVLILVPTLGRLLDRICRQMFGQSAWPPQPRKRRAAGKEEGDGEASPAAADGGKDAVPAAAGEPGRHS